MPRNKKILKIEVRPHGSVPFASPASDLDADQPADKPPFVVVEWVFANRILRAELDTGRFLQGVKSDDGYHKRIVGLLVNDNRTDILVDVGYGNRGSTRERWDLRQTVDFLTEYAPQNPCYVFDLGPYRQRGGRLGAIRKAAKS